MVQNLTNPSQLYRPYSESRLLGIIRQEATTYSVPHLFTSGLPAVIAYHVVDFVSFRIETFIDAVFDSDENDLSEDSYGETVQVM